MTNSSSNTGHDAQGDPVISVLTPGHETAGAAHLSTWTTLLMAREAWDIGRPLESWRLMDEARPDCAYVRRTRTSRIRELPNFRVYQSWDDEYEERIDAAEDVREYRREFVDVDWLAWQDALKPTTLNSFDAYLRSLYTTDAIREMAIRPNPLLSMLQRTPPRPSVMYVNPTTYEDLLRSMERR